MTAEPVFVIVKGVELNRKGTVTELGPNGFIDVRGRNKVCAQVLAETTASGWSLQLQTCNIPTASACLNLATLSAGQPSSLFTTALANKGAFVRVARINPPTSGADLKATVAVHAWHE